MRCGGVTRTPSDLTQVCAWCVRPIHSVWGWRHLLLLLVVSLYVVYANKLCGCRSPFCIKRRSGQRGKTLWQCHIGFPPSWSASTLSGLPAADGVVTVGMEQQQLLVVGL
jgi:hypothetical protein